MLIKVYFQYIHLNVLYVNGYNIFWGEVIYYLYHELYMKMFTVVKYYHGSHEQQIN